MLPDAPIRSPTRGQDGAHKRSQRCTWQLIRRKVGGLDGRAIGASLLRMHSAAAPAAVLALAVVLAAGLIVPAGRLGALVTALLAGAVAVLVYVLLARSFGVAELTELLADATSRRHR